MTCDRPQWPKLIMGSLSHATSISRPLPSMSALPHRSLACVHSSDRIFSNTKDCVSGVGAHAGAAVEKTCFAVTGIGHDKTTDESDVLPLG